MRFFFNSCFGLYCLISTVGLQAQSFTELAPMPERITNNAIAAAQVDGEWYVYSFAGLDSTKSCNGDHLRSWRYQVSTDTWSAIPSVPDAQGGKIAAAASAIQGKIYVVGGYHLAPNCDEVSSARLHIFDPVANEWLPDGMDIPVAIDDQVQAVWQDSLLYVVTGWSNTTNVTDVQIYNPVINEWAVGTAVPTSTAWRVFGASGTIIGDTLYYAGGASLSGAFNASSAFRKGYIHPDDPLTIDWADANDPLAQGYRMGAADWNGAALWFGGSLTTYNFDGIAYNGSGGVAPLDRIIRYDPSQGQLQAFNGFIPPIMDLRGIAQIDASTFIIAGGMEANQTVTNKTWMLALDDLPLATTEPPFETKRLFFPNPTRATIQMNRSGLLRIHNTLGQLVLNQLVQKGEILSIGHLLPGTYWAAFQLDTGQWETTSLIVH